MAILRTEIENALDEFICQEAGMEFQDLAVVIGKMRWPELVARPRKKDLGLDAYAPASQTEHNVGRGLASSITATNRKVLDDMTRAKEHFPDLKELLFVTPVKVGSAEQNKWQLALQHDHEVELHVIEREEIIAEITKPENGFLRARLGITVEPEPEVEDLIERTKRAATGVTQAWAKRTKMRPLIDLNAVLLDETGAASAEVLSLDQIDDMLSSGARIVLEGPAGRGKTTTLIQLAQRSRSAGIAFIVQLSTWLASGRSMLEYIAGMPALLAEDLTPSRLARVQEIEPLLLLLNGWNEIAASSSEQASDSLRELERDFPGAGIVVATRTHHLTPPLPGALRLRLSRLRSEQREAYLADRLGSRAAALRARIETDASLDELTRSPFVLSEVSTLFEAGEEVPSTKLDVLARVLRVHEERDEHRNSLAAAPISGLQSEYMQALAAEMTSRGAVALKESEARETVAATAREMVGRGLVDEASAPTILASLTAHHLLEFVEYPERSVQFEHQQYQEHYAAIDVRVRLLDLHDGDRDATDHFTAVYVNSPAWAEPLCMIAETFAERAGDEEADEGLTRAAGNLVRMALLVDLPFAGELARLCGPLTWKQVRSVVGERFRAALGASDENFRPHAIAAMLATGSDDFCDVLLPLLSSQDQQTRLRTYRLWPDTWLSSLGSNWRAEVGRWEEAARADFVSEMLHDRVDDEIVFFATEDRSAVVKRAAASALMWTGSHEALRRVLESMDADAFREIACQSLDRIPDALRAAAIAAVHRFVNTTTDELARLRAALYLVDCGEPGLEIVVRTAMTALSTDKVEGPLIAAALECLRNADPIWTSRWVATQIAESRLYGHEKWLPFARPTPDDLVAKYLRRLETEALDPSLCEGMVAVIAAQADTGLASRVFANLREMQDWEDSEPGRRGEPQWQLKTQLQNLFRRFPDHVRIAGVLSSVKSGDVGDIRVTARLFSRVARADEESLQIADDGQKALLQGYLRDGVDLVLSRDDFNGQEKADLGSVIAQIGEPEDMGDLVRLIRADIERVRQGRVAQAAGDRGPLANGSVWCQARWHVAALVQLDPSRAEQVLVDLLREPEYVVDVAAAMAHEYLPEPRDLFDRGFRHDVMWAAREGRGLSLGDDRRRSRFAAALTAEMERLQEVKGDGTQVPRLNAMATALAAVDGRSSATAVLAAMAKSDHHHVPVLAAERLLMAGAVLPSATAFALVDSVASRTEGWMGESDRHLLCRVLSLCPFVDEPAAGVAKMREVLEQHPLPGYELRELVVALGESRSASGVDLLRVFAADELILAQCEYELIGAVAKLGTPRAQEMLLGFVDPEIRTIALTRRPDHESLLVDRLVKLAASNPEVARRLRALCESDLPEVNRQILSKTMGAMGTRDALSANLLLVDDNRSQPIPWGVEDQLEATFVERRPYEDEPHTVTLHARAANETRGRLLRMARTDRKRRKSALALLGKIEVWRLEYGRPVGEPRHPDLTSGQSWPPAES